MAGAGPAVGLTDYSEQTLLNVCFGNTTLSHSSVYLALGTVADDSGLTTEVSATGYARTEIPGTDWAIQARGVSNTEMVYMASSSTSFGSPTFWAIYDAVTGGNCLFLGEISPVQEITANQQAYFTTGELAVTMDAVIAGSGMSDSVISSLLLALVGQQAYTVPTDYYVGFTSDILTSDGLITGEEAIGGYARVQLGTVNSAIGVIVGEHLHGRVTNAVKLEFTVSADWPAGLVTMFIASSFTGTANSDLIFLGRINIISPLFGDIVEIPIDAIELLLG